MPRIVRGDIDGFFGLFVDNLVQLIVIAKLCPLVCGIPSEHVTQVILPGAAISILIGNLFYCWQAWRLMRQTGRNDVTALPYGINTPSVFAFMFLIMAPVYRQAQEAGVPDAWKAAWQVGLFACFCSGVIECVGALVGDWLRRYTPRAALLSALAGIAITFISMTFVFQIFAAPEIGMLPMIIVVVAYASRVKLPLGVPAGLLAVLVGTALGWLLLNLGWSDWKPQEQAYAISLHLPAFVPQDTFALIVSPSSWSYLSVIFPMGLFNVIGSLQNLESAEAAGDRYPTRPSLLANGLGTVAAALLGSAFPTTIYIGHPGWKSLGARGWYSLFNGVLIAALCLIGGVTLVRNVVPDEAAFGILLWIGIIIVAQAFEAVPRKHALAVAFGLVPALAAWGWQLINTALGASGGSLYNVVDALREQGLYVHGVIALDRGFLLTSMVWAAVLVFCIERRYLVAAGWSAAAAMLSVTGIMHGYELTPDGAVDVFLVQPGTLTLQIAAPAFASVYAMTSLYLIGLYMFRSSERPEGV